MTLAFIQAILNGLMTGALIALPAVGFTTIFAVLRYPSFVVAAYMTIGAFTALYFNLHIGWGILPCILAAAMVAGVVSLLTENTLLAPLRPAGPLTVAIGSIALNMVLENVVRFIFGNDLQGFDMPIMPDVRFTGLRVGAQQLQNLAFAVGIMALVFAFLRFTQYGRAMRAVADNPDLSRLKGISPKVVSAAALFIGAGLAGTGGVLLGLDTSIDPLTGYRVLLSVFAAAVLGGLGSVPGAILGALAIGVAEEVAMLGIPATYRGGVAFLAILIMLTFRPRGLLGERAT